jgi:hypothetical protein
MTNSLIQRKQYGTFWRAAFILRTRFPIQLCSEQNDLVPIWSYLMEVMTATRQWEVVHGSATLFVEDLDSMDEQRCLGELIDYLIERGAEVKGCE